MTWAPINLVPGLNVEVTEAALRSGLAFVAGTGIISGKVSYSPANALR